MMQMQISSFLFMRMLHQPPNYYGIETFSMDTASDEGAKKVAKKENSLVKLR